MEKIRNLRNKLICQIDRKTKTVEILIKDCVTVIKFTDDDRVKIINKYKNQ